MVAVVLQLKLIFYFASPARRACKMSGVGDAEAREAMASPLFKLHINFGSGHHNR